MISEEYVGKWHFLVVDDGGDSRYGVVQDTEDQEFAVWDFDTGETISEDWFTSFEQAVLAAEEARQ